MMNANGAIVHAFGGYQEPPEWMGKHSQRRPGQDHNIPETHMQVIRIPRPALWISDIGMTLPSNVVEFKAMVKVTAHCARHGDPEVSNGDRLPNSPQRWWTLFHQKIEQNETIVKWPEVYVTKTVAINPQFLTKFSQYRIGKQDCLYQVPPIQSWRWPDGALLECATGWHGLPDSMIMRRLSNLVLKVGIKHPPTGITRYYSWQPRVHPNTFENYHWYPNSEFSDEWINDSPVSDSSSVSNDEGEFSSEEEVN